MYCSNFAEAFQRNIQDLTECPINAKERSVFSISWQGGRYSKTATCLFLNECGHILMFTRELIGLLSMELLEYMYNGVVHILI